MKDNSLSKLGGTCAVLQAVSFIVVVIAFLPVPADQRQITGMYTNPGAFLESFAKNSTLLTVVWGAEALGLLLGIAAVLAISESVRSTNEGWVRWTSTLAIIGLALWALDDLRFLALTPGRAAAYVQGDAAIRAALTVPGALDALDPRHWLRVGTVGVWALVVSLLALRGGIWPKPLAYVGIGAGSANLLVLLADVFPNLSVLEVIGGIAAIISVPIWYIWLGLRLRKAA